MDQVAASFPNLQILGLIGSGGMGAVFRARQPKLDRLVALKVLPASLALKDPAFAERFEREGQMMARLHHPNIVTVFDSGQAGEFFFLIMEYVDGVNLRQAMQVSRFTPDQALAIVPRICEALQFAHEEGVLHRDIKPENILLDAKGRIKLVDFGVGKILGRAVEAAGAMSEVQPQDPSLTQVGTALGTPQYMAPEQRERPESVDQRADIYSLGVVFYELLTGELPVGKFEPPSRRSPADPRVDAIVQQALESDRTRRQSSAGEVKTQLETVATAPRSSTESSGASSTRARRFRTWGAWGLFSLVVGWALIISPPRFPEHGMHWFLFLLSLIGWIRLQRRRNSTFGKLAVGSMLGGSLLLLLMRGHVQELHPPVGLPAEPEEVVGASQLVAWFPENGTNGKPDLQVILKEASDLARAGEFRQALQRQIWFHRHALEVDPSYSAVRLSFALSQWVELGRLYPEAKAALDEISDVGMRRFAQGDGSFELFLEVRSINEYRNRPDATVALFNSTRATNPKLAQQCYPLVEEVLLERGEYSLCASFVPNVEARFRQSRNLREMTLSSANRADENNRESMRLDADQTFTKNIQRLVEILVSQDRKSEAQAIQDRGLALVNSPVLLSAVEDAERRVAANQPSLESKR